nr:hypothetical protein [Tanacetum cinerariifolium]
MLEVLIGKASAQLAAGQDGKACSIIKHVTRNQVLNMYVTFLDLDGGKKKPLVDYTKKLQKNVTADALMEIAFQLLAVPVELV